MSNEKASKGLATSNAATNKPNLTTKLVGRKSFKKVLAAFGK
jgi:hypothetical protein